MQTYDLFDIIGPRMVGPSSSHTAGAARLGRMANKIAGGHVKRAHITLFGSFATTGRGHGTDKAIVAGILGMEPDDERLRYSMLLAKEADVEISVDFSEEMRDHPNTAEIEIETRDGNITRVCGASIGGGSILITEINGLEMELSGEYPALIVRHRDVPGVINTVTNILANEHVNVAFMRVFRHARRQEACMVIETDSPVSERVCRLILDWNENISPALQIVADKMLIQKAINNIVSNAILYSPRGSSIYMDAFSKNGSVVFQIENTGVHIPEAEISKLFDAFYRMEQSRNRKTGGSGLGLYIVKTILEQHNIIYSLKNTDRGVLFSIRF